MYSWVVVSFFVIDLFLSAAIAGIFGVQPYIPHGRADMWVVFFLSLWFNGVFACTKIIEKLWVTIDHEARDQYYQFQLALHPLPQEKKYSELPPINHWVNTSKDEYPDVMGTRVLGDITWENLVRLSKMIVRHKFKFSYSLSGSGKPITRTQFEVIRDRLLNLKLARDKQVPNRVEVELLGRGRAYFKAIAALPHPEEEVPPFVGILSMDGVHTNIRAGGEVV